MRTIYTLLLLSLLTFSYADSFRMVVGENSIKLILQDGTHIVIRDVNRQAHYSCPQAAYTSLLSDDRAEIVTGSESGEEEGGEGE